MQSLTYYDGDFIEGNPMIMGPLDQSFWFATMVFDGGRAFDGVLPDIEKHSERCLNSARIMGMEPAETVEDLVELTITMARKFPRDMQIYVRPTFWCGETDALHTLPELTKFLLCMHEAPMEEPKGASVCLSSFRRPAPDMAMTLAKASSLYPTTGEAIREAKKKGFSNAVMLDHEGHVAEFATSNLFAAQDGVVHTPTPNGTFLNGITRQRVIGQLRDAGIGVVERSMTYDDVASADEVFSTGNYSKVLPVTKVDGRDLQPGPIYRKARELYFEFARDSAATY